jgi:60 kDa SS-A/Ro ribonucleoprotein
MSRYLRTAAAAVATPPQSEPLDERQVKNSAGGFVYAVDDWTRLDRWIILGSEKGTYYASEQKLTVANLKAVAACVKADGLRVVERIVELSESGRAYKNDPALMALAYAAGKGDDKTRVAALDALPKVARIGTHLFHFASFVEQFRGWGRGLRGAVANWYTLQTPEKLADQITKYQQRDGWSHRDLLRLAHKKFTSAPHQAIAHWVVKNELTDGIPERIHGHVQLQQATSAKQAADLIRKFGLVRESVPTELLSKSEVWEALLEKMPMTAMIRNLGNMSKCGLLKPLSDASKSVCEKLATADFKKARVHPIQLLIAQKTYGSGRGNRGSGEWDVVPQIVDALDDAFYKSFQAIVPSDKRFYLGIDVSGSMSLGEVAGVNGLTPRAAAATMAMVTARSEKQYYMAGFQNSMVPINITSKTRLDEAIRITDGLPFGSTDCAQPMIDAQQKGIPVDVFVIYTDSESFIGNVHAAQALRNYRHKTGIDSKLIAVGMVANEFSVCDPEDGGCLDVVGFDSSTPNLISDFSR